MPQASDSDRAKWGGEFGIGEDKASNFLIEHDWHIWHNGLMCPGPKTETEITPHEWEAAGFLMDEWDYSYQRCARHKYGY